MGMISRGREYPRDSQLRFFTNFLKSRSRFLSFLPNLPITRLCDAGQVHLMIVKHSHMRGQGFESPRCRTQHGVLAQLEACVLSKDEVLGSKPRYSKICVRSHGLVGYDARLTRERSRVRSSVRILFAPQPRVKECEHAAECPAHISPLV